MTRENISMEKQANLFARALLMPKPLLVEEFEKIKLDKPNQHPEDTIIILAKKFKVSEVQMTIRIKELNLKFTT